MPEEVHSLTAKVPALRRHAYLFTGSRSMADDAVETCLRELPRHADGRHAQDIDEPTLHRHLHKILTEMQEARADLAVSPRLRSLLALPRVQRKLLLLVSLDHLAVKDAAGILGLDLTTAVHHLSAARSAFEALEA
ncbi:sigma factor-like helix-turn-helix DNA-binding protein [Caenispirillum salinarum]|uniref:sigma factor-like helix-turn-helix DNA-binding protein n=1 Tax=Caenispirillum salinarum TaxID=859058 RepID=UPI0038518293